MKTRPARTDEGVVRRVYHIYPWQSKHILKEVKKRTSKKKSERITESAIVRELLTKSI